MLAGSFGEHANRKVMGINDLPANLTLAIASSCWLWEYPPFQIYIEFVGLSLALHFDKGSGGGYIQGISNPITCRTERTLHLHIAEQLRQCKVQLDKLELYTSLSRLYRCYLSYCVTLLGSVD